MSTGPVKIILYRWGGSWGPFKVNIPCGECSLTVDVISDTFINELADTPVELETHEWLSQWWRPLKVGRWHAPIVIVGGADQLQTIVKSPVAPNPDRDQSSMSSPGLLA
ncbi:MAG: hypothetical protein AB8B63_02055 [Granulosicoccus sp.]